MKLLCRAARLLSTFPSDRRDRFNNKAWGPQAKITLLVDNLLARALHLHFRRRNSRRASPVKNYWALLNQFSPSRGSLARAQSHKCIASRQGTRSASHRVMQAYNNTGLRGSFLYASLPMLYLPDVACSSGRFAVPMLRSPYFEARARVQEK